MVWILCSLNWQALKFYFFLAKSPMRAIAGHDDLLRPAGLCRNRAGNNGHVRRIESEADCKKV